MSIAVTCPSCSVSFTAKDDYAGKRAKCPKCGEPLIVPGVTDRVKMPPPVVAARPKPAEDDPPRARKPSGAANERSKPRRKDDAGEEAARRGRHEEVDEPKKKGSALPLILGLLVVLVLVCGGGGAGLWFLWLKPELDRVVRVKGLETQGQQLDAEAAEFRSKGKAVQAGMTRQQVEEVFGRPGRKTGDGDLGLRVGHGRRLL